MNRRPFLATLCLAGLCLAALSVPTIASADIAPPPVSLHIEGQRATLTAAAPDRAEFVLENVSDRAIEAYVFRVIVLDGRTRVPIQVDRVEVDGRASGRTVRIPAHGRIRLSARFALPTNMRGRASYRIDLSVRQNDYGVARSTPAQITRRPQRS